MERGRHLTSLWTYNYYMSKNLKYIKCQQMQDVSPMGGWICFSYSAYLNQYQWLQTKFTIQMYNVVYVDLTCRVCRQSPRWVRSVFCPLHSLRHGIPYLYLTIFDENAKFFFAEVSPISIISHYNILIEYVIVGQSIHNNIKFEQCWQCILCWSSLFSITFSWHPITLNMRTIQTFHYYSTW